MRRLISAALIALPLVGLGGLWYQTLQRAGEGIEWDVPVTGYDPRDLLKGHYVQYSYQWPESPDAAGLDDNFSATGLCLDGKAPTITHAARFREPANTKGCAGIARAIGYGARSGQATIAPRTGRLYVSQAEAQRLTSALPSPKQHATLRFRLRPDGIITPLRLSFAPKP